MCLLTSLFSFNNYCSNLVDYDDVWYLYDPQKSQSQIDYEFIYRCTIISWRSTKQLVVASSSNYDEIIFIMKKAKNINDWGQWYITFKKFDLKCGKISTILHKYNVAYIIQLKKKI